MKFMTIPDDLWCRIAPSLPAPPEHDPRLGGRPRTSDRLALNGILFVLSTGIPWQRLPVELGFGSGSTCWRRLRAWEDAGVWDAVWQRLLDDLLAHDRLEMRHLVVDGSKVSAKRGAPGPAEIPLTAGISGSNGTY